MNNGEGQTPINPADDHGIVIIARVHLTARGYSATIFQDDVPVSGHEHLFCEVQSCDTLARFVSQFIQAMFDSLRSF